MKYRRNWWQTKDGFCIIALGKDFNKVEKESIADEGKWYKTELKLSNFSSKWELTKRLCKQIYGTAHSRRVLTEKYGPEEN